MWNILMWNILEKVPKADYDEVKANAIYLAESRALVEAAFRRFRARWRREYGATVRWNATCRRCYRSLLFRNPCGRSGTPPR